MKTRNIIRPLAWLGVALLAQQSAYAAKCEYIVSNEWNTGFVASIRITNDSTTTINNWSVNWAYSDGSIKTSSWNATVAGNNPYSATGVGWNNSINPGQFIEFGVQGNKGVANSPAQKPAVTGSVCGSVIQSSAAQSSVIKSSVPSSAIKSSVPVVSSSVKSSSISSSSVPSSIIASSSSSRSFVVVSSSSTPYEKEFTIGNANELRVPIRRMNKYDAYRISVTSRAKTEEKNLVARYKFEQGLTAVDAQGGAALRLVGADTIKGKYLDGSAVQLNGVGGHAQLPNGLLDTASDFTVATWIKLDAKTPWARVFDFGKGTGSYMMLTVRDAQNNIRFDIANAGVTNSLTASGDLIKTGIWHHVAIAQRGSNARMFIDGVEVANSSAFSLRANQLAPTTANYLGKSQFAADSYLDGAVDDIRIYNRALSRFEITNLISHKYEAENAQITGGTLHLGADALFMSSNDGYVGGLDFANSKLQFAVNVPKTGIYTLAVRYANGTADNAVNYVQANGVAQRVIDLPSTGGWLNQQAQIARSRVLLQAGDNTLVLGRQSGHAEIDYIEVREDTHQYQAEMAKINNASYAAQFFAVDGVKGCVGRMDFNDSSIEFMVDAPAAGGYKLKIAYANGTTANAVHTVLVNSASATSANYAPSGGWFSSRNPTAIRGITNVTVQLNAGYNRVVLQRTSGYAEIDYVQLLVDTE